MREQEGGKIINFYSIDADAAAWLHADYNTTKAAIQALTRSAAMEWARFNIRANCLAPGAKGNVYHRRVSAMPELAKAFATANPMGRVGDAEDDTAPAALFLATDDSRHVTGETLSVDGGQHLPRYNSKPPDL
jgi:NAD(P)-dependent dehydrogenase (short-subunit alcohol dehydrogenase family)